MQIIKCIFVGLMSLLCANVSFAEIPTNTTDSVVRYNLTAVQQYKEAIKNISGNLLFKRVCADGESKNSVCENDIFSDANVQMMQAIGLAQEYILIKHKKESVCSPAHRASWNDDYISCTTADNSMFFEFKFDDVFESLDIDIKTSVGRAVCKMHGGHVLRDGDSCTVTDENMCNKIDKSLQRFGYNANFVKRALNNACEMQYNDTSNSEELRTAYGIDNMRFRTLQLRSGNDLRFFIKRHVESILATKNIELSSFRCEDSFKTLHHGFKNVTNVNDDILTCYVNDQPIDFVFDDMQESWNSISDGGTSGLQCIAVNGGNYDGRRCLGLTKDQCAQASKDIVGGTRWDSVLETCVLNSADKAANINRSIEVVTNVGLSAGVIVLSLATGGAGSAAILCAVVGTGSAIGSQVVVSQERDAVATFTAKLSQCSTRQCVRNEMIWFIDHGANYINNLTDAQTDAIDIEIADKLSHLNMDIEDDVKLKDAFAKAKDKDLIEKCKGDALQTKKCVFDAATILFDFLPVTKAALKATGSLGAFTAKLGTKMPRTASVLVALRNSKKTMNVLKATMNTMDKLDTTNDVYSAGSSMFR